MFAGNAAGQYLPPMVVYKSESICREWVRGVRGGGLRQMLFMNTQKMVGLIQEHLKFVFLKQFLSSTENRNRKVVLIGDNLESHFFPSVIQECIYKS